MSCRARGWAETWILPAEQEINIILHLYYRHLADAPHSGMETLLYVSVSDKKKPLQTLQTLFHQESLEKKECKANKENEVREAGIEDTKD